MREKEYTNAIYYPIPIHNQVPYKNFPVSPDNLINTMKLSDSVISLPMHPYLSSEDIDYIANIVDKIIKNLI